MTEHSSRHGIASLAIATLLLMGAPRVSANEGNARAVPTNPFAEAPTPAPRPPSARAPGTALEEVHDDRSADPISSVPDRDSLAADAAAERRRARAEERARVRMQRARERARERAARADDSEPVLMSVPPAAPPEPRPRSHMPAPLRSSLDRAFTAPVTPRAHEPPPAPDGAPVQLSRERPVATIPLEPLAAAAVSAARVPVSVDHAIATLDAALSSDPAPVPEPILESQDTSVPTREQIENAVASVTTAVRACAQDRAGHTVHVHTVFHRSGRVARAEVDAPVGHVDPRQRSCMARAARRARTPAFEGESFSVTYSLRL